MPCNRRHLLAGLTTVAPVRPTSAKAQASNEIFGEIPSRLANRNYAVRQRQILTFYTELISTENSAFSELTMQALDQILANDNLFGGSIANLPDVSDEARDLYMSNRARMVGRIPFICSAARSLDTA